jgi:hypothetical protein
MYKSAERRRIAHYFGYTDGDQNGRYQGGGRREEKLTWGQIVSNRHLSYAKKLERYLFIENKR